MFKKELLDSHIFNWKDINGKTLEISVNSSVDSIAKEMVTVVMGYEKATGVCYLLHQERKVGV